MGNNNLGLIKPLPIKSTIALLKKKYVIKKKSEIASLIFAATKFFQSMEQSRFWAIFWWAVLIVSSALLALAIYTHWEWLTLLLPFVATSFVKALKIM